jgi:7-cyano-7-deazaguanine synthase
VPFRNAFLGLVAVNFAVDHRASEIRLGFHKPYPGGTVGKDQMPSFVAALNRLVTVSIEEDSLPVFLAPFQSFTKTGIARRGRSLGVPFELVWTCYTSEDKPCGACSPCGALKQALDGALEGA